MVTVTYVETSAAMKLIVDEPESEAIANHLATGRRLVSSWLLHTELHCAAGRHPDIIGHDMVNEVLSRIDLIDLSRGHLIAAGSHAPLRSNDAVHLVAAISLGVDELATYDSELSVTASQVGISVLAPR